MKIVKMGKTAGDGLMEGKCLACGCCVESFPGYAEIDFALGILYVRCPYCQAANIHLTPKKKRGSK